MLYSVKELLQARNVSPPVYVFGLLKEAEPSEEEKYGSKYYLKDLADPNYKLYLKNYSSNIGVMLDVLKDSIIVIHYDPVSMEVKRVRRAVIEDNILKAFIDDEQMEVNLDKYGIRIVDEEEDEDESSFYEDEYEEESIDNRIEEYYEELEKGESQPSYEINLSEITEEIDSLKRILQEVKEDINEVKRKIQEKEKNIQEIKEIIGLLAEESDENALEEPIKKALEKSIKKDLLTLKKQQNELYKRIKLLENGKDSRLILGFLTLLMIMEFLSLLILFLTAKGAIK